VISSSQRPLPDNTQHSQQTDIHAPRWDSNPQSQQVSGRRPTPYDRATTGTGFCLINIGKKELISRLSSICSFQDINCIFRRNLTVYMARLPPHILRTARLLHNTIPEFGARKVSLCTEHALLWALTKVKPCAWRRVNSMLTKSTAGVLSLCGVWTVGTRGLHFGNITFKEYANL